MLRSWYDGFLLHRLLEAHGVHNHVIDPASLQVDRRARRAKTDGVDVGKLLRSLMAYLRGDSRRPAPNLLGLGLGPFFHPEMNLRNVRVPDVAKQFRGVRRLDRRVGFACGRYAKPPLGISTNLLLG
jgi:transposase